MLQLHVYSVFIYFFLFQCLKAMLDAVELDGKLYFCVVYFACTADPLFVLVLFTINISAVVSLP